MDPLSFIEAARTMRDLIAADPLHTPAQLAEADACVAAIEAQARLAGVL